MPKGGRLSTAALHARVLDALGSSLVSYSNPLKKPLDITLNYPLPQEIRLYLYNLTSPPGGRTLGEHKIQLMVPGQRPGERGNFDFEDGKLVFMAGYELELDVFVFWDAGLYEDFPFSMNVQVKAESVFAAFAGTVIHQERRRHSGPKELVTITPASSLRSAIAERVKHSLLRILGGSTDEPTL